MDKYTESKTIKLSQKNVSKLQYVADRDNKNDSEIVREAINLYYLLVKQDKLRTTLAGVIEDYE